MVLLFLKRTEEIYDFIMNLFPKEDILTKEIESWKAFANVLNTENDRREFEDMLNNYYRYSHIIINAGSEPFPSKTLVMALLLSEYKKIMQWLIDKTK
ncbi:MAG TPA: hypothetical protein VIP70_05740 [Nitrososphaeraceae archaeon]